MVAEDGAVMAQQEGGAEEGLEGEGGRVVAKDGASVAQREGDAVEGLEGEGEGERRVVGRWPRTVLLQLRCRMMWWL